MVERMTRRRLRQLAVAAAGGVLLIGCGASGESTDRPGVGANGVDCPPLTAVAGEPPPTHSERCARFHDGPPLATADPLVASPGGTVTITPAATIDPNCGDAAFVMTIETDSWVRIGVLSPFGDWLDAREADDATMASCSPEPTAAALDYVVPVEMAGGMWRVCRTAPPRDVAGFFADADAAGCADVRVTPANDEG